MNRRDFFKSLGLVIGGVAVEQAIPLGRVWSFPTNIVIAPTNKFLDTNWVAMKCLELLHKNLKFTHNLDRAWDKEFNLSVRVPIIYPSHVTVLQP